MDGTTRQDDDPFGGAQVERLCRGLGVLRLDLFGSAATGRFDPARGDLVTAASPSNPIFRRRLLAERRTLFRGV